VNNQPLLPVNQNAQVPPNVIQLNSNSNSEESSENGEPGKAQTYFRK
jgi:hypothetical protein